MPLLGLAAAAKAFFVGLGVWAIERIGKYLISLGVMGVAYVGVDKLIDMVVIKIKSNIASVAGASDILMMAGIGEVLNIILAACAFVLTERARAKFSGDE